MRYMGSKGKRGRYLGMHSSSSFHAHHPATKQYLLEICGSTIDLSPQHVLKGPLIPPPLRRSRSLPAPRDARNFTVSIVLWSHTQHPLGAFNAHVRCGFVACPCLSKSAIRRGRWKGSLGPRFIEWSLSFDLFSPLPLFPLFHFGFWIRGPSSSIFSLASSLPPPQLFLTFVVSLLSCATFPIYHPLCRSVYICRSIARIQLFVNYGTSLL